MDKTEIKCRFRRSVESYEENATVQKLIAERLFQLLEKYSEEVLFRILEVGCGTGLFTRKLKRKCEDSILVINDIVEEMCCKTSAVCEITGIIFWWGILNVYLCPVLLMRLFPLLLFNG